MPQRSKQRSRGRIVVVAYGVAWHSLWSTLTLCSSSRVGMNDDGLVSGTSGETYGRSLETGSTLRSSLAVLSASSLWTLQ